MNKRHCRATRTRPRSGIYRRRPRGHHLGKGGGTIINAITDVMKTLAAPFEVSSYGRVVSDRPGELNVAIANFQQSLIDTIGLDDFAVVDIGTERLFVVGNGGLEIVNRNGNMVDMGEQHARRVRRLGPALPPSKQRSCDTDTMAFRPDDLEAADLGDPAALTKLLHDAAARIRELEKEGVRAVGGTIAEMLEQAVKSGEEIVEQANADADSIRVSAETDAATMIDHAAAIKAEATTLSEAAAADAEIVRTAAAAEAEQVGAAAEKAAAKTTAAAEKAASTIASKAEKDAIARSTKVLSTAQKRLDRLLAAERDVHDRLQAAMADIQASVSRVGVNQGTELALTVEDPALAVDEATWADDAVAVEELKSA